MFGPLIHAYTRADAIADGALIDVTETAAENGYRFPVAITCAAWAEAVAWAPGNLAPQDEDGRLWDVLHVARIAILRARGFHSLRQTTFPIARIPNNARATVARVIHLQIVIGPGDDGRCVLTIGLPGED